MSSASNASDPSGRAEQASPSRVPGSSRRELSRRDLLRSGGALGAAAVVASGLGRAAPKASLARSTSLRPEQGGPPAHPVGRFVTEPGLVPPEIQATELSTPAQAGYVMLTPSPLPSGRMLTNTQSVAAGKGQMGTLITDLRGRPLWFKPSNQLTTNLQVQSYRGQPVLTYWEGKIVDGIGYGTGYLLDAHYQQVATVKAGNGLQTDLHELTLTPQNTALITAYRLVSTDTTALGGSKKGSVYEGVVQEIDVATGKLLFEWRSLDHVPVGESYVKAAKGAIDYFHINSIGLWDDSHLLVSARSTWTVYLIDRHTGAVVWRLNGKKSDFAMGPGSHFYWQHHVRRYGADAVTIFDDGATPAEEAESRGLVLHLDLAARRASVAQQFIHPTDLLTFYEGSMQMLPGGHAFVGWGTEPYASEFDAKGNLVLDLRLPTGDQSYRAFRYLWTGLPKTSPLVAVEPDGIGGYAVYVSWNGATEVASWQVLSGGTPAALAPLIKVARSGFETAITVHPKGHYLAVAGLDAEGRRLGVTRIVKL